MPYVAVLDHPSPELDATAERRWTAVIATRPDLAPAIELQRRLLTLVRDLDATLGGGKLPRLSLPPKYLAAKLGRGVPAFAGEPIPLPIPAMAPMLLRLCDALAGAGAGDAAGHIREALASGQMDAGSLLAASLARNQGAIRSGSTH